MPERLLFGRVVIGAVLISILLAVLFALLNFFHFRELDANAFSFCSPRDAGVLMSCVTQVLYGHLADPHWVGAQFSMYVTLAAVMSYLLLKGAPAPPLLNGIAMAAGSVALLVTLVEPGMLCAVSAFCGIILGTLVVQSRRRERVRFNK